MMAMGSQGQANHTMLGQQQVEPGPDSKDKPVAKPDAKEPKQGAKLKNVSLSGAGKGPALTPRPEIPKVESKVDPVATSLMQEQERKRELQRQAELVVQRLRQSRARRTGLEEAAAQLKHSTFSALNLEVSSGTRRGKIAQPLSRQSLEELRQNMKDMQRQKLAAEKTVTLSMPPGSWAGKPSSCSASTTASDDVDGMDRAVESDEDNLAAP